MTDKASAYSLPVGLVSCGFFLTGDHLDESKLKENVGEVISSNRVIIFGATNDKNIKVHVMNNDELEKIDHKIVNDEKVYSQYMFVRCQGIYECNPYLFVTMQN